MEIRQYKSTDLEIILYIWEEASRVGLPFLSQEFLISERERIPLIYLPNGDAWVAVIEGRVAGFSILHGNEVGALFVNPEYHGKGVGFALMNKAKELHRELSVEVFKENGIGNNFYSRYGFELKCEYRHEETEMMMVCLVYRRGF